MRVSNSDLTIETGQVLTRMLDTVGWGVFFIWVGMAFLANVSWGVTLLGIGIILLGAQGARSYFSLTLNQLDKTPIPAWAVPILFIVLGIAILVSLWLHRPRE
jgi:hypothetical protein